MPEIDIDPRDRILLPAIPDHEEVRAIAVRAREGIVVGLGTIDEVHAARKSLADLDNVMFVPFPDDGRYPFQDCFFSKVIALHHAEAEPEMLRALAPGGAIHLSGARVFVRSR